MLKFWDFPGGTVDKSQSTNAGDMSLIRGPGRSTYCVATGSACHSY